MNFVQWVPIIVVLPTFAFIAYWMWRQSRASGLGRLPRTLDEVQQVDDRFKAEFASAGRKLRWFNFWLMLAIVAGAIIWSVAVRK